ncbi:MAG TPA: MBL fold metallo-hydrolase, partial [Clostridiales bacterium UBA8960]|nr:MBL fold metallo-hydrolase [Clostridiales bacterium UBA8960]
MSNTKILDVKYDHSGVIMRISPVLILSGDEMIIVDVGMPGRLDLLDEAMAKEGYGLVDLTKVVITHHDHDHFGALAELKRLNPKIEIVASEFEVPYLEGRKKSLRLTQAESLYDTLPEERKEWARNF